MLAKPRSRNRRQPRTSLLWPKTGSTMTLRLAYNARPAGVRTVAHVTGQDKLTGRIDARVRMAAVGPAFRVRAHDMQLGIRKVTLGPGVGALHHRWGGFAPTWLARPCALRCCGGSALTRDLRFCLGLRCQASHGRLDLRQTIRTACQCGGELVGSPERPRRPRPAGAPVSPRPPSPRADAPRPSAYPHNSSPCAVTHGPASSSHR